ncbi:MAG: LamG-like jellyroll fold domain-containing protein [Candidatus Neomarinimicrobiota bacterium]
MLETEEDNYSLSFDGESDYVELPDNGLFSNTNAFTINADIYIDGNFLSSETIFAKGYSTESDINPKSLLVHLENDGSLSFILYDSGSNWIRKNVPWVFDENDFNNITLVYNGGTNGNDLEVYINGSNMLGDVTNFGSFTNMNSNNDPFLIGARVYGDGSTTLEYTGRVDDLAFWNSALTEEEIQANMNANLSGNEEGLVAYWNFNEGSGDILTDFSGNENDGTINGATWNLEESNDSTNSSNLATTISDTISLTIAAVNDAPVITDLESQVMFEDDTLKVELSGSDVDGDDIYFVTESVDDIDAFISNGGDSLIIIPQLNWNGNANVPVHLFDGSGANDVTTLDLTVEAIDDPTLIVQSIPDAAFIENFQHSWDVDLNSVFSDVDNDLSFSAVLEDPSVIGSAIENDVLQLFSEEASNGVTDMVVSAWNPEFPDIITAADTFQVSVANANNFPVIAIMPDTSMNEDDTLKLALIASDVDGDELYFVVGSVNHASAELNDAGDSLILIPEADWFGQNHCNCERF